MRSSSAAVANIYYEVFETSANYLETNPFASRELESASKLVVEGDCVRRGGYIQFLLEALDAEMILSQGEITLALAFVAEHQ